MGTKRSFEEEESPEYRSSMRSRRDQEEQGIEQDNYIKRDQDKWEAGFRLLVGTGGSILLWLSCLP